MVFKVVISLLLFGVSWIVESLLVDFGVEIVLWFLIGDESMVLIDW